MPHRDATLQFYIKPVFFLNGIDSDNDYDSNQMKVGEVPREGNAKKGRIYVIHLFVCGPSSPLVCPSVCLSFAFILPVLALKNSSLALRGPSATLGALQKSLVAPSRPSGGKGPTTYSDPAENVGNISYYIVLYFAGSAGAVNRKTENPTEIFSQHAGGSICDCSIRTLLVLQYARPSQ